jgi:hypothetical protein
MDSSIVTMMHGVRGYFRFAHIDGLISADPAEYARLPKVKQDESRTPLRQKVSGRGPRGRGPAAVAGQGPHRAPSIPDVLIAAAAGVG